MLTKKPPKMWLPIVYIGLIMLLKFFQSYPIYVCRALNDGIFTSGFSKQRQGKTVCIVVHTEPKIHHNFDILLNKGHGGKLTWKPWNKFIILYTGSVSASGAHVSYIYFITYFGLLI